VPCQDGWYPMNEASFGEGWPNTSGSTLSTYLASLTSPVAVEAKKRLLLPPDNPAWENVGAAVMDLLLAGGVVDGLRLHEVKSDSWESEFRASRDDYSLPSSVPPSFTKEQWSNYRAQIESERRPSFSSLQTYVIGTLYVFPGFAEAPNLPEQPRLA